MPHGFHGTQSDHHGGLSGVRLGGGCSLCQSEEAHDWGQPPEADTDAFPDAEVFDDWAALSPATLDHFPYLAQMDAGGFRDCIPAFLQSVLTDYQYGSMRVLCTLDTLSPRRDGLWEYHMGLYSLLNRQQHAAIARTLHDLSTVIKLYPDDQKGIARALRNYWQDYL